MKLPEKIIRKWFRFMIRVENYFDEPWLRDRWRHDSDINKLKRGIKESERGEVEYLGSFAKYANDDAS